jgi:hypothetical protein
MEFKNFLMFPTVRVSAYRNHKKRIHFCKRIRKESYQLYSKEEEPKVRHNNTTTTDNICRKANSTNGKKTHTGRSNWDINTNHTHPMLYFEKKQTTT